MPLKKVTKRHNFEGHDMQTNAIILKKVLNKRHIQYSEIWRQARTWLTLQVDSGDRRLTSGWGPPVEIERKEDLSLCLNILSLHPHDH